MRNVAIYAAAKRDVCCRSIRSDEPQNILIEATAMADFKVVYTRADLFIGLWMTLSISRKNKSSSELIFPENKILLARLHSSVLVGFFMDYRKRCVSSFTAGKSSDTLMRNFSQPPGRRPRGLPQSSHQSFPHLTRA
jgi:hypothetical protein